MDALRSQIPRKLRFTQPQKARMALAAKVLGRKALKEITTLVTPDTLFHWYREAVRAKWDYSNRRGLGRPEPKTQIETFILEWAGQNKGWGYTKLRDALRLNGFQVSRNTVKKNPQEKWPYPRPQKENGNILGRIHQDLLGNLGRHRFFYLGNLHAFRFGHILRPLLHPAKNKGSPLGGGHHQPHHAVDDAGRQEPDHDRLRLVEERPNRQLAGARPGGPVLSRIQKDSQKRRYPNPCPSLPKPQPQCLC